MRSCQKSNDASKVSIDFFSKIKSSVYFRRNVHPKMLTLVAMSFLFITTAAAVEDVNKHIDSEVLESCVEKEHRVLEINEGWPVLIGCSALLISTDSYYSYHDYESFEKSESQCVIQSKGSILYSTNISKTNYDYSYMASDNTNSSYRVDGALSNMNGTIYKACLISNGECTSISYTLLVKKAHDNQTCSTALTEQVFSRQLTDRQYSVLICTAKEGSFFLDSEQYQVTWYKDCNEIRTKVVTKDAASTGEIDELKLTGVNFTTAGDYSCSVTYKNTTRYLSKIKVCVKYASPVSYPYIRRITSETQKVNTGSDVTLTCGGTASSVNQLSFAIVWSRNHTNGTMENICRNFLTDSYGENMNSNYDCSILSNLDEATTCYTDYEEAMKDRIKGITTLNSSLTIKNFQKSDEGQYVCKVVSTRGPQNVSFKVMIKTPDNFRTIILIAIVVVLLLIISAILIVMLRRNCIQRLWKKRMEKARAECDSDGDNRKSASSESSVNEKEIPQDVV